MSVQISGVQVLSDLGVFNFDRALAVVHKPLGLAPKVKRHGELQIYVFHMKLEPVVLVVDREAARVPRDAKVCELLLVHAEVDDSDVAESFGVAELSGHV